MSEYSKGDIVLLSHSKLGVMTSSNSVREIRGDPTQISRIVKKLSAKELAETLVDLMERYNNLETKSNTTPTHTLTTNTSDTKRTNTVLHIPKTPNYGNHAISPTTDTVPKNHILYHYNTAKHPKRSSTTPSTTQSLTQSHTTTTSTISSLSPNITIEKSPKPLKKNKNKNKKLFAKITHSKTPKKSKSKKEKFLFKTKKGKANTKNEKICKRSQSNDTHTRTNQYGYEYMPYNRYGLPFSHTRSNPDDYTMPTHYGNVQSYESNVNAHKTRITRAKSTDTPPYHSHLPNDNNPMYNPYYIASTPSHNTANSTITPPIPSPNGYVNSHLSHVHNIGYRDHGQYVLSSNINMNNTLQSPQSTYSSTAPIPAQCEYMHAHPPSHIYNKAHSNLHNVSENSKAAQVKLIDELLVQKPENGNGSNTPNAKMKSHPMSYKKRTLSYKNNTTKMVTQSRTNLTQSPSHSECNNHTRKESNDTAIPPTYPQQYVPAMAHSKNTPLNLLKSPVPPVDPILQYHIVNKGHEHTHIKNASNTATMDSTDTLRDNIPYNYTHENSYTNSSVYNKYKINRHYNDSMIYDSYNGLHSISPRQSRRESPKHSNNAHYQSLSMQHKINHSHTHQRGGSHSPRNNSYHRKNYHRQSPKDYHRPFSANHQRKALNYFDFGPHNQIPYTNTHRHTKSNTKSVTFSLGSEDERNNKTITRIYPNTKPNTKPKLSQNNAYSQPYNMHYSNGQTNENKMYKKHSNNHWKQSKTMGNEQTSNNNSHMWFMPSYLDDAGTNTHERSHTDTMIIHAHVTNAQQKEKEYNEGRKSHSVSHLGQSMDDMTCTPLTLSPATHRNGHRKQKRSQSVVEFFDPNIATNLADLHHKSHINSDDRNERDKAYKIVLRKENSNKAYYIQDNIGGGNNDKLIKPRFSRSNTSVLSTAQSSANSFTPTISQTPSYLREDNLWQKSMTHKLSQTSDNASSQITSDSDEDWMLHNHININGNTNSDSTKHRFFGNDVEEFPNIKSPSNYNIESPSNKSSDTVKIISDSRTQNIANENELKRQLNNHRKYRKENNTDSTDSNSDF